MNIFLHNSNIYFTFDVKFKNNIMAILIIILAILFILELRYHPRLDYTIDGKYLLWYDKKGGRDYKVIFTIK